MFWPLAIAIGVLATLFMTWPMLRFGKSTRNYGLALVLLVPIISVFLYQDVGTPDGIGVVGKPQQQQQVQQGGHTGNGGGEMDEMVSRLEQRLQENPADVAGWVLLGRTYKTVQRYDEAEAALIRAAQIAPDDATVLVELAEAKMFSSGNPTISGETREMLERALLLDPNQQKGMWLLGMAASQSGNNTLAVELWEKLVAQVDPSSPVSASLKDQIAQAKARMGEAPAAGWAGIDIQVELNDPGFTVPPGAVLFIVARNPDMPGPPLGVRRIGNPVFPVNLTLSDQDSMVAQNPVSSAANIQLLARLSMSGNVVAGAQDLSSETITGSLASMGPVSLKLAVPAP
jgi:cytochrome c-type biogenesis protein CcmH